MPSRPAVVLPCEIVLTHKRSSNGRLVVRCRCMAQTVNEPRPRFYAYDPLGEATSLPEALELWRKHRESKSGKDADSSA
jgi:hypothetical protein